MTLAVAAQSAVAAWTLDEASGTRADQVNDNDLSVVGTVGSVAGKFGNAASFGGIGSPGVLKPASVLALTMVRFWFRLSRLDQNCYIFTNGNVPDSLDQINIAFADLGFDFYTLQFSVGGQTQIQSVGYFGWPAEVNRWYLAHAWFSLAGEVGFDIDAADPQTGALAETPVPVVPLKFGGYESGGLFSNPFEGQIDDAVVLNNYVLSADERTEDWNGGDGVAFADWAAVTATEFPLEYTASARALDFAPSARHFDYAAQKRHADYQAQERVLDYTAPPRVADYAKEDR